MIRGLTLGFAVVFGIVVAIGYVPAFITMDGDERMLFGLFRLSLIDDITHGVTAVAAVAAGLGSAGHQRLFLTAFGFYYGLDAIFYLTHGFFNDLSWVADILLNLPHVGIAVLMLGYVYWYEPRRVGVTAPGGPA